MIMDLLLIQWVGNVLLLGIMAYLDWKKQELHSFYGTLFLIYNFAFAMFSNNILFISFGILFALIGLLLYDFDLIKGTADIKVLAGLGLMIGTITGALTFFAMFVVANIFGFALFSLRKKKKKTYPYIPILLGAYIFYLIINLLI